MAHSLSSRLERPCAIVAAGFWLGGLVLLWAMVRPAPRPLAATLLGSYFLGWGTALVLAAPPRSRVIARFSLTTLALALPPGCLELLSVVGMADFRTLFTAPGLDPRHNADNVPDPELIHVHRPYLKRAGATRGDIASALHLTDAPLHPYEVAYDRNGFRNARDLSEAEIVVLGDSFVEGGLVAADDLLTATLGRLLGCNVANLGQSAYGPQQELAVLNRYAAPLRPRLCIWTFYEGNDLDDVARYEQLTQGNGRAARSTPRDRSFGRNALLALSCRLGRILVPDASDQAPSGTFREMNGRTTRLFFRDRGALHPRQELSALDEVTSVLTAAHAACAAYRMTLLVVFAPQKFRIYKDYCTFPPDNPCTRWAPDDLPERLRARVAAIGPGIRFLDLTPALAAEAARGRLLYFADDTHWSAEGHQAAGRAIAADIARRGDLGPPSPTLPQRQDQLATKEDGPRRR
jgi:SGNH hydrolase-like domain, acetyltransferase AlgX